MFADDLRLLAELNAKYGPFPRPIVDVGGLERPCIADYQVTIDAMKTVDRSDPKAVADAQMARYQDIHRPLSFLDPDYLIENPETGGLTVEALHYRYEHAKGTGIGTAVLLSVLEHVANPFRAVDMLEQAMELGGLAIVSVPWIFPHHPSPRDLWRFSPDALRELFSDWEVLACDWRLMVGADEGVLNMRDGRPQAIESAYIVAARVP